MWMDGWNMQYNTMDKPAQPRLRVFLVGIREILVRLILLSCFVHLRNYL